MHIPTIRSKLPSRPRAYWIQPEPLKSADCGRREPNSIKTPRTRRNILVRRRTPAHGPRSRSGNACEARGPGGTVGASRRSAHHVTSPRAARALSPARAPRCPRMRHRSVAEGRGGAGRGANVKGR